MAMAAVSNGPPTRHTSGARGRRKDYPLGRCHTTLIVLASALLLLSAGPAAAARGLRSSAPEASPAAPVDTNTTLAVASYADTVCPAKAGYSVLVNYDHAYNDLTPSWVADPQSLCDTDSTCKGFNLRQDGTGQPKNETLKGAFQSAGYCLYTKQDIACPPQPGYSVLVNQDHDGDSLPGPVSLDPVTACNQNTACAGFSYSSLVVMATLKSAATGPTYSPGRCLYIKQRTLGVCCAFVLDANNNWATVCDDPTRAPGAQPFPNGTVISSTNYVPGQLAQCVGRFPYPMPAPYKLPASSTQLMAPPDGVSHCADQLGSFYEGLSAYGSFIVQCTNS